MKASAGGGGCLLSLTKPPETAVLADNGQGRDYRYDGSAPVAYSSPSPSRMISFKAFRRRSHSLLPRHASSGENVGGSVDWGVRRPGPTMLILLQVTAFGPCLDFPVGSGHGLERIRASYRERIPVH